MDYPVKVWRPDGTSIVLYSFGQHITAMARCRHPRGFPPRFCSGCMSYAIWERGE